SSVTHTLDTEYQFCTSSGFPGTQFKGSAAVPTLQTEPAPQVSMYRNWLSRTTGLGCAAAAAAILPSSCAAAGEAPEVVLGSEVFVGCEVFWGSEMLLGSGVGLGSEAISGSRVSPATAASPAAAAAAMVIITVRRRVAGLPAGGLPGTAGSHQRRARRGT